MKYEEFVRNVQQEVQKKMGKEVQVEIRKITRNNGFELEGLSISKEEQRISPMIYLEDFYSEYEQGMTVPKIADEILEIYENNRISVPLDTNFYKDFAGVKSRIVCKLINYKKNEKQLESIPHVRCMDLAIVFYYMLEHSEIGNGRILIYKSHLTMWQVSLDQLYDAARKNTPELLPYEFKSMAEILEESSQELEQELEGREEMPMYVLSNQQRYLGAVNLLYDSILSEIAREIREDFYVLPSSIHECIIVPVSVKATAEELRNMVQEINSTQVLPEEVLSDNIYFYEKKKHKLSMCQ